jgi:hypothetical protein
MVMNASGPFGLDAVRAVFRVQKISVTQQLHGERDANEDADARGQREARPRFASRSGTEQTGPIRHGLWRHAPFVAQIIGQILPRQDGHTRLMDATYDNKSRAIPAIIDTRI